MALRLFVVHDDDSITRIPYTRFRKLLDGETREPEWTDQRIRCVEVIVEVENRKPISMVRRCPFAKRRCEHELVNIEDTNRSLREMVFVKTSGPSGNGLAYDRWREGPSEFDVGHRLSPVHRRQRAR